MTEPNTGESWVINLDGGHAPMFSRVVAIDAEHVRLHVVVLHRANEDQEFLRSRVTFVRRAETEPEPVGPPERKAGPPSSIVAGMMDKIRKRTPDARQRQANDHREEDPDATPT